jgi:porin
VSVPARAGGLRAVMAATAASFLLPLAPAAAAQEAEEGAPAVDLGAVYKAEIWRNVRGGLAKGWRYVDNLDVTLTIDGARVLGWDGATIYAHGIYNNGESLSSDLVGDVQFVSNIDTGGVEAARLFEAWVEQRFAADRASIKLGVQEINIDFDNTQSGALFINSSHGIGPEISLTGTLGPSTFPFTGLAARVDYAFDENWLVRAAIFDGVPGNPDRLKRTTLKLRDGEGALLIGEVNYIDDRTKIAAGYWRYTARFEDILATALAEDTVERGGNDGFYMIAERKLAGAGAIGEPGLTGWLRLGFADETFNAVSRYLGGGIVWTGPFGGRPEDQAGIAFADIAFGEPFRRASALAGDPETRHELMIEATYRAPITPWLALQPDLQYVVNPGGNTALRDALVAGLRVEVGF